MHGGCAGGEVGEEHKRGVDSVGCTRGQSCLKWGWLPGVNVCILPKLCVWGVQVFTAKPQAEPVSKWETCGLSKRPAIWAGVLGAEGPWQCFRNAQTWTWRESHYWPPVPAKSNLHFCPLWAPCAGAGEGRGIHVASHVRVLWAWVCFWEVKAPGTAIKDWGFDGWTPVARQ